MAIEKSEENAKSEGKIRLKGVSWRVWADRETNVRYMKLNKKREGERINRSAAKGA